MNVHNSVFKDISGAISISTSTSSLDVIRCCFLSCSSQKSGGAIYFGAQGSLKIIDVIGIDCQSVSTGQFLAASRSVYSQSFNVILNRIIITECKHIASGAGHSILIKQYKTDIKNTNCSNNKNYFEPGFNIESSTNKADVSYSIFENIEATCYVILSFRTGSHISTFDHCAVTNCKEPTNIQDYDPGMVHSTGRLSITNCNFAQNTCRWLFTTADAGNIEASQCYISHSSTLKKGTVAVMNTIQVSAVISIEKPEGPRENGYILKYNKNMIALQLLSLIEGGSFYKLF